LIDPEQAIAAPIEKKVSSPDRDVSDFPNLKMSVGWFGRRAGAEPDAQRSARPTTAARHLKLHQFFYRASVSAPGS